MNILLGFDGDRKSLVPMIKTGLEKEGIAVDDIVCLYSKKTIEEHLSSSPKNVDVVIVNELIEAGNPYREKEVERLTAISEKVRVILVVSKEHMGDKYMQNLINLGYYNALYDKDTTMSNIAGLIKSSRNRRVATAYYGVTGATVNDEVKSVMTVGMALDLVRECHSKQEVVRVLKHVYGELGEVGFSQFVEHLPREVYELGAVIEGLSKFFPVKATMVAPEVSTQYKEVKNEVIAVIDENCVNGRSSYLAMGIARSIATNTNYEPSYIKLPYGDEDVYNLFPFTKEFKDEFISHLQAVLSGVPYPTARNMYEGVSVVCKNPVIDMLDSWDMLCSYKCIYNAAHPAIVDIGKDIENKQLRTLINEASLWCVVVPEETPVNAYLLDLKQRMGASADIPIIAVTKSGHPVRELETHSEIGLVAVYDNDPLMYEKNESAFRALVGLTPYVDRVVDTPKKFARPLKSKFKAAKVLGTKEIGIMGGGHGCGCTYTCVSMASLLAKHYKVAVVEMNKSGDFECMGANIKCKRYIVDDAFTFSYKGVDYFYGCTYDYFHNQLRSGYDFVIYDCGIDEVTVFGDCDVKVAVVPGAVWRMDEVDMMARLLDMFDARKQVSFIVNGKETKELSNYRILTHKRAVYGVPFANEPYVTEGAFAMVMSKIIGVTVR